MSEIKGTDKANQLDGTTGDDTIWAYAGNDTVSGLAGNDRIITGDGEDVVDGGVGNDVINGSVDDASSGYYPFTGSKIVDGGDGNDLVYGGSNSDTISGGTGDDKLYGLQGADLINGGDGNDKLTGGTGSDSLVGGAGDDVLYDQESGNDTLLGGTGNDNLNAYTGTGNKYMDGGEGNDTLFAGTNSDTLVGGSGNDELHGYEGNDSLDGGEGNDSLYGGDGNDALDGGGGVDLLRGEAGDDKYTVSNRATYIYEESGSDSIVVNVDFYKVPADIEKVIYASGIQKLPYWIDALLINDAARVSTLVGNAKKIYFSFPNSLPIYDTDDANSKGYLPFNSAQKTFSRQVFTYIASVIDIKFEETVDADQLNTITLANNAQVGSAGYATYPSSEKTGGDLFLDKNTIENLTPKDGQSAALTLIHELGHALGLKHPFSHSDANGDTPEAPYLPEIEENTAWTVMSYADNSAQYHAVYSPLDVAALQYIYGPSATARTGADTYTISETSTNFIWDGGGTDKINAAASSKAVTIYLEPGYWGYVGSAKADTITKAGQITVNFGSQIEILDGSSLGDCLYGNGLANVINGNAGNDTITGNGGNDKIDGGAGQDTVVYALSAISYTVSAITGGFKIAAKMGTEGTDTLLNVERLQFANKTVVAADFVAAGGESLAVPKFWKNSNKTPSNIKNADAVNLTDAIAILKMIVGLNVNSNNTPLSPYQAIAADFDQSGDVGLTDAIGVLKMVVGLSAPTPTWKYYDDTKLASTYTSAQSLNPKNWTTTAVISDTTTADSSVKLVGVLTGDVDGSWTGA